MLKKINLIIFSIIFLFVIIPFVSSAPPQENPDGLKIRSGIKDYLKIGNDYDVHIHVFNINDGLPVTDASCYLHLYHSNGTHIITLEDDTIDYDFDYTFRLDQNNITEKGSHPYIIQCNTSTLGGFISGELIFNNYGEELKEGSAITFNFSMVFLMVLWVLAVIGIFAFDNPVGKWACYFIAHVLFIVGTFSVWQFNEGYAIAYTGLASMFKVFFYVSTFALFPIVILAISWMVYYHTLNDTIKSLIERGMDEKEAQERARREHKWL